MSQEKPKFDFRLPLIAAICVVIGIIIGSRMFKPSVNSVDTTDPKTLNKFKEVLNYIQDEYVDKVDLSKLVENAIVGMLSKMDPHSLYIPCEEVLAAHEPLEGNFEGIGVEFNIHKDTIMVVAPISGGPSETIGIKAGDKIIKVENEIVAGINITNRGVMQRLRGQKGTIVNVSILRKKKNKLLKFAIRRDKIPTYSVDVSYMINDKTGYIKISRFANTTYEEFLEGIKKLKASGMKQLIIDLRNNYGGYMGQAVSIADELLSGHKLIVYTEGYTAKYNEKNFAGHEGLFEEGPLIVLIDEGSASASEILAGAIQDNDRGLIVGRRSFGKGLVQIESLLPDSSAIRLTTSRYYIPSGRCIQKPYDLANGDYNNEVTDRIKHGELLSKDSIHTQDTTRYKTLKGRVMYGGGGIMPDIFMAMDTSYQSEYLYKLYNHDLLNQFAFQYAQSDMNLAQKYVNLTGFRKKFVMNEKLMKEFINYTEQEKVKYDAAGFNKSKIIILTQIKALIARNFWKNDGYFPVIHESDNTLQESLSLFNEAEKIEKGH